LFETISSSFEDDVDTQAAYRSFALYDDPEPLFQDGPDVEAWAQTGTTSHPDLAFFLEGGSQLVEKPEDYPGIAGFAGKNGIVEVAPIYAIGQKDGIIGWSWTDKSGKTQKRVAVRQANPALFDRIQKDMAYLADHKRLATEDFKLPSADSIFRISQDGSGVLRVDWKIDDSRLATVTIAKDVSPTLYDKAHKLFLEETGGIEFDWSGLDPADSDVVAAALKEIQAEDAGLAERLAEHGEKGGRFVVKPGKHVPGDVVSTISFADGTTEIEVPAELLRDKARLKTELKKALATLPPLPQKLDVAALLNDPAVKASDLIDTLVRSGNVAFSSFEGKLLRERVVEALDRSPFLKWCFTEHMKERIKENPLHTFVFAAVNGEVDGALGNADVIGGHDRVNIWKEPLKDRDKSLGIVAHEIFHQAPGLGHHGDMHLAMAVFAKETGLPAWGSRAGDENFAIIGDNFNRELFAAAVRDFREAGVFGLQDTPLDSEETKRALDKLYGPGHGLTVHEALSRASQGWPGDGKDSVSRDDFVGLTQAYLHAVDGGEVEKIHAAQLKRMGFADPEKLKEIARKRGNDNRFGVTDYDELRNGIAEYLADGTSGDRKKQLVALFKDYGVDDGNLLPLMVTLDFTDTRRHQGLQRRDGEGAKDHFERLLNTLAAHYADEIDLDAHTVPSLRKGALSYEAIELLMTYLMVNAPDRATMTSDDLAESAIDEILERVWNAYKNKYEGHRNKDKWREGQGILRNYFNREDRKGYKAIRDLAALVRDRVMQAPR
jgi:hypothetical protein